MHSHSFHVADVDYLRGQCSRQERTEDSSDASSEKNTSPQVLFASTSVLPPLQTGEEKAVDGKRELLQREAVQRVIHDMVRIRHRLRERVE